MMLPTVYGKKLRRRHFLIKNITMVERVKDTATYVTLFCETDGKSEVITLSGKIYVVENFSPGKTFVTFPDETFFRHFPRQVSE